MNRRQKKRKLMAARDHERTQRGRQQDIDHGFTKFDSLTMPLVGHLNRKKK